MIKPCLVSVDTVFCPGLETYFGSGIHFPYNPNFVKGSNFVQISPIVHIRQIQIFGSEVQVRFSYSPIFESGVARNWDYIIVLLYYYFNLYIFNSPYYVLLYILLFLYIAFMLYCIIIVISIICIICISMFSYILYCITIVLYYILILLYYY